MTDRELMQQALEALYLRRNQGFSETYSRMADATITALRERLAQPEQPSVPWSAALESVWGEPEQERKVWRWYDLSWHDIESAIEAKLKEKNA